MCHKNHRTLRRRIGIHTKFQHLALLLLVLAAIGIWDSAWAHEFSIGPCQFQYMEPCTSKTIAFYIFSSEHPKDGPILLDPIDPHVPAHISLNRTNKLIVHGYGGSIDFNATKMIRKAYLRKPETNVFIVDWGKLARLPCYPTAAFNTKQAGECTATFLIGLQANHPEFSTRDLHAIGFSLGAHVLSFTSNALEKSIGFKFRRITGLDPALPFFATARAHWKLDQGDADFVDVIHTNAGVYGKIETCGHVDFYMNGGQNQPGCENHPNQPLCSHKMSAAFFAESINSKQGFWATRCSSYFSYFFGFCKYRVEQQQQSQQSLLAEESGSRQEEEPSNAVAFGENLNNEHDSNRILMGEYCSNTVEGVYFVQTNREPPFAMGF
ncbi:phospholipase A1-like [Anopheles ziemanni]|uniref:phospholipase A1-like n=1 Tax=Anopheles coustani TaxID=139045 RepID=UPI002658EB53|nr:phospholipase A1-like [Anopheles coustani]XP_058177077.1 phospholipase A1-like [Anopheles ziemanni]